MPLRLIPDDTNIPFMKLAKIRTPISLGLMVLSFVLLFTVGLNQGIDFKGGTVIEVRSKAADRRPRRHPREGVRARARRRRGAGHRRADATC